MTDVAEYARIVDEAARTAKPIPQFKGAATAAFQSLTAADVSARI